jgi:hypothetical protein
MVAVKYDDLSMAFDFISSASPMEHNAYVSLCVERGFRTNGVDPLYSTLTQTNTEVLSLPVSGFLAGSVLMYRYLPSILN